MKYYLDVTIKKSKVRDNWIMNEIFNDLHLKLVSLNLKTVGISFPEIGEKLGKIFRIHGSKEALDKVKATWNDRNLVTVGSISLIPEKVSYVNIKRKQSKFNNARLKRLIKRNNLSKEDILAYKKKMLSQYLTENFVELKSSSNKNHFKLFFNIQEKDDFIKDEFNFYGLSQNGTVPIF